MRSIMHIDFNSYFASVEQQANPRLRGKPVGVTGGDRMPASPATFVDAGATFVDAGAKRGEERTVLGAASVEAKRFGIKTGMQIWQAKKLCPNIILVKGDSDKYLEVTKRFLTILKDYSPYLEVFSIDEVFIQIDQSISESVNQCIRIAKSIKSHIKAEIGEWITCSIGISYNKLMAKLAGSLQKPDGLVVIPDQKTAMKILDGVDLDGICGIGSRTKTRLNNMGIFNFTQLRKVPKDALLASFKSYGQILYNMARGIDNSPVVPFYEKEEVKSVGHRHTIDHDTNNPDEIKQILLKLTELMARRLRAKNLVGKTIHCWYRQAHLRGEPEVSSEVHSLREASLGGVFAGEGMQMTITYTNDGLEIFKAGWKIFGEIWDRREIRMIGVSVSNLKPQTPQNLSLLPEFKQQEIIIQTLDKINNKYGEFTLQRGILLGTSKMRRMPTPFLADRRFKL